MSLASYSESLVLGFFIIFIRVGTIAFFVPGVGERFISNRLKLGAALAMTFLIVPALTIPKIYSLSEPALFAYGIIAEFLSGFCVGILMRLFIFALQTAGTMISQSLSLAQLFTPQFSADAETPFGTMFVFAAITMALVSGLHVKVIIALIGSFELFPIGVFPDLPRIVPLIIQHYDDAFSLALQLSMPIVVTGLTYNLIIGAANRAMPQMLASLVGAPAIALLGLIVFTLILPGALVLWNNELTALLLSIGGR